MSDAPVEGGCLCGATRYRFTAAPIARSICHCRSCRRASGAPSVAWIVVARGDFAFIANEPARYRSSMEVIRTFCRACGTPLTYQHDDSPDTIDITTATLDDPERFAPEREIWLDHRITWTTLNPALPHYAHTSGAVASG
jgi:hypothetical protein